MLPQRGSWGEVSDPALSQRWFNVYTQNQRWFNHYPAGWASEHYRAVLELNISIRIYVNPLCTRHWPSIESARTRAGWASEYLRAMLKLIISICVFNDPLGTQHWSSFGSALVQRWYAESTLIQCATLLGEPVNNTLDLIISSEVSKMVHILHYY